MLIRTLFLTVCCFFTTVIELLLVRVTRALNRSLSPVMKIKSRLCFIEGDIVHLASREFAQNRQALVQDRMQTMDPQIGFGLADPKESTLHRLEVVGLQIIQNEKKLVLYQRQGQFW
jgi:hypothetical protein